MNRKVLIHSLLVIWMFGSGCSGLTLQRDDQALLHQRFEQGKKLFKQKKYASARKLFLSLQSKYPGRIDLAYNLGTTYLKMATTAVKKSPQVKENLKKAEKSLKSTLVKGSAQLRQKAHYNLGVLYAHKRQFENALYQFEMAVALAKKTLKVEDKSAKRNQELMSLLLRQRDRRRRKLNRTRIFRYEPKVIVLTASQEHKHPLSKFALRGIFTHKQSKQKVSVWGYPTSSKRWEIRFIPTRSGKWSYKISTIHKQIPGSKQVSKKDPSLQDKGIFKVLPSARAGQLVISSQNIIRLAWKKPKDKIKLKKKKKSAKAKAKKNLKLKGKKAKAKQPRRNAVPQSKKAKKKADDEKIILWKGIGINGLFHPSKLKDKGFQENLALLRQLAPTAIHVAVPLVEFITWSKQNIPTINDERITKLAKRLKKLRANPTDKWAFVLELQVGKKTPKAQIIRTFRYLIARLAHTDLIWSLRSVPEQYWATFRDTLQSHDPYSQPIALHKLPKSWLSEPLRKLMEGPKKKKPSSRPTSLKIAKKPKKKQKAKKPSKIVLRYLIHSSSKEALGPALRQRLVTPWIADLKLDPKVTTKKLIQPWWGMFTAGLSTSLRIARPFDDAERKKINSWLQELEEKETVPAHPSLKKKKKKLSASSKPSSKPSKKAKQIKSAKQLAKVVAKPKKSKANKKTAQSNAFIHYLIVRQHWENFLGDIRFNDHLRPDMVQVRVPDYRAMMAERKKLQKQRQQQLQKLIRQKSPTVAPGLQLKNPKSKKAPFKLIPLQQKPKQASKDLLIKPNMPSTRGQKRGSIALQAQPLKKGQLKTVGSKQKITIKAKAPTSRPKFKMMPIPSRPKMRWKLVRMRSFICSNGLTTLFLAPDGSNKKPPQIQWKNVRWDLEFSWFNARTGKFLKKNILRQVTSLALTKPKKEVHIAKVMLMDHPIHTAYTFHIPKKILPVAKNAPWRVPGWIVHVKPMPRPGQKAKKGAAKGIFLPVYLGSKGYQVRFRPNKLGFWKFRILKNKKPLKGFWGLYGQVKVVPGKKPAPAPLQLNPKNPRYFMANRRPFFFFTKRVDKLLSSDWDKKQFTSTLAAIQKADPGTSVLAARLPVIPWGKHAPTTRPSGVTTRPASLATLHFLERLDQRIEAIHKAGLHLALIIDPKQWGSLTRDSQHAAMNYLLDRYATAYPVLFMIDHKNSKAKADRIFPQMIMRWYLSRYPYPMPKKGQKQKKKGPPPIDSPPLVGGIMGRPGSEARLKNAFGVYTFVWLEISHLFKALKDYKLARFPRPIILTSASMKKKGYQFTKKSAKGVVSTDLKKLQSWARFLWQTHMMGFHHSGPSITQALKAPKQKRPKLKASSKMVAVLRGFFQNMDWTKLFPRTSSVTLKSFQAFGAETATSPKAKKLPQRHDIVIWANRTVQRELSLKRNRPLKKHRYLWIDPLTGKQPIQAQLLPPMPAKKKADKMPVPFKPAVMYIYRRPPQKKQKNKKNKKQKQQRVSKRQQVRNRLKRLNEDRNDLLKKMLKKRKKRNFTGKRG